MINHSKRASGRGEVLLLLSQPGTSCEENMSKQHRHQYWWHRQHSHGFTMASIQFRGSPFNPPLIAWVRLGCTAGIVCLICQSFARFARFCSSSRSFTAARPQSRPQPRPPGAAFGNTRNKFSSRRPEPTIVHSCFTSSSEAFHRKISTCAGAHADSPL